MHACISPSMRMNRRCICICIGSAYWRLGVPRSFIRCAWSGGEHAARHGIAYDIHSLTQPTALPDPGVHMGSGGLLTQDPPQHL